MINIYEKKTVIYNIINTFFNRCNNIFYNEKKNIIKKKILKRKRNRNIRRKKKIRRKKEKRKIIK